MDLHWQGIFQWLVGKNAKITHIIKFILILIIFITNYDDDDDDDDGDDVQWFNVHLKPDMPEKNEKQLESVESVRWVER